MKDNMNIFSKGLISKPNLNITLHNIYYEVNNGVIDTNNSLNIPQVFLISGEFDSFPKDTYKIQIKIPFLKAKTSQNENVSCSGKGIEITKCIYKEGLSDFIEFSFKDHNNL